jgi:hypothetical protein
LNEDCSETWEIGHRGSIYHNPTPGPCLAFRGTVGDDREAAGGRPHHQAQAQPAQQADDQRRLLQDTPAPSRQLAAGGGGTGGNRSDGEVHHLTQ